MTLSVGKQSDGLILNPQRRRPPGHRPIGVTAGFWVTVECLDGSESEPTVIVDAAGPHRFRPVFRTLQCENIKPQLGPEAAKQALELVQRTMREGRAVTAQIQAGHQRLLGACHPVFGPSGAVHAVRMAAGMPEGFSPPIPLIPVEFDTGLLARFGNPDGPAPALFGVGTTWTLPAILERVVWLDKRLDLIALFDPVEPGSRWCESLVVEDPVTQMRRHLWMAARSVIGPQGVPIVRGVIADLTSLAPVPERDPLTEHLATHTPRGHGSALMDLRTTLMHSFACHDDPRLAQWRHKNPHLHPEDLPAVMIAVADLTAGRPATLALRIRFTHCEPWTTLRASCVPLVNYSRPQASIDFWIENTRS